MSSCMQTYFFQHTKNYIYHSKTTYRKVVSRASGHMLGILSLYLAGSRFQQKHQKHEKLFINAQNFSQKNSLEKYAQMPVK